MENTGNPSFPIGKYPHTNIELIAYLRYSVWSFWRFCPNVPLLHTGKVLEDPRKTKGGCWGFIRGCSRESLLWWCWCWGEKPAGASNGGFEVEVMHNSQSSVTQKVVKICQYRINSLFLVLDLLLISFLFTWRNWWQILWKFDFSCQQVSATSMQNKK